MTERRYDPTAGEWVTFATDRQERTYRPEGHCPLCPSRPGGPPTEVPFERFEVVVFDNRFPAFSPAPPVPAVAGSALYPVAPALGRCEVVVYSDDHEATFADLPAARVRLIVDVWADRTAALGTEPAVAYVMPFENKGEAIGATLSHPHGQVYGYPEIPPRARRALEAARRHLEGTGRCVHCDVVAAELADGRRVVAESDGWVAWVPFAARLPYEVHVAPATHRPSLPTLTGRDRDALASLLSTVTRTYDRLWDFPLPYVMAVHQEPTDGDPGWRDLGHVHVELTPMHRSADRLKYLAGSELAGGAFVSDVAPEDAAARLREARPDRGRERGGAPLSP